MITSKAYDSVIIGAGAAGMAAACKIKEAGFRVALLDRENHLGGILLQCIHNGFGLHHFKKELTGPEYAEEYITKVSSLSIDTFLETTVTEIRSQGNGKTIFAYSGKHGVLELQTRSIVLAMGSRERNRGNIGTAGTRPSGIFTAGLAQRLLNIEGFIPGKKAVIVGSGDIGLIMARRLSWTGSKVLGVVELQPYPSGLTRNIVQCLQDFNIPLFLSHAVTQISGKNRVEKVTVAPLKNGVPVEKKRFDISCDTVLLSVGLIPENELSRKAGVTINPNTNGPMVDYNLQTTVPGIFACGNVLHVHDLVDFVSEEAEACGINVSVYLGKGLKKARGVTVVSSGANIKYVIPNQCALGMGIRFLMRPLIESDSAELILHQGKKEIHRKKLRYVRPAEMISLVLSGKETRKIDTTEPLEFYLSS